MNTTELLRQKINESLPDDLIVGLNIRVPNGLTDEQEYDTPVQHEYVYTLEHLLIALREKSKRDEIKIEIFLNGAEFEIEGKRLDFLYDLTKSPLEQSVPVQEQLLALFN